MEIITSSLGKMEVPSSSAEWCFERLKYMEQPLFLNTFQSITKMVTANLLEIIPGLYHSISTLLLPFLPSEFSIKLICFSSTCSSLSITSAWISTLINLVVLAVLLFYLITTSLSLYFLCISIHIFTDLSVHSIRRFYLYSCNRDALILVHTTWLGKENVL